MLSGLNSLVALLSASDSSLALFSGLLASYPNVALKNNSAGYVAILRMLEWLIEPFD
jgi:hypothetical protein